MTINSSVTAASTIIRLITSNPLITEMITSRDPTRQSLISRGGSSGPYPVGGTRIRPQLSAFLGQSPLQFVSILVAAQSLGAVELPSAVIAGEDALIGGAQRRR